MDYITFFSLIEDKPPLISNFIPFEEFYDFWYFGKTTLNTNYSSCLILMMDKENTSYFNVSFLFLLNVKDTQLLSITRIAKSSIFAGEGYFEYLKLEEDNTYSYRIITLSEAIVVDEMSNIVEGGVSEKICGMFKFDDQGYVKSLRSK